jgi:hypothetical protein
MKTDLKETVNVEHRLDLPMRGGLCVCVSRAPMGGGGAHSSVDQANTSRGPNLIYRAP